MSGFAENFLIYGTAKMVFYLWLLFLTIIPNYLAEKVFALTATLLAQAMAGTLLKA